MHASGSFPNRRLNPCNFPDALYAALMPASVSQLLRLYEHPSHLTQYSHTFLPLATAALRLAAAPAAIASSAPYVSSSSSSTSVASSA